MRVIVCGSRYWENEICIYSILRALPPGTIIVEGECRGADLLAKKAAESLGFEVEPHPADWARGRKAGPIRNQEMLDSGIDLVIAFHHNLVESLGTRHMLSIAIKAGIPVLLFPRWKG